MALSSGTRLGPYEILGAVGAGGMGEVYKARDTRLERTVAIKVLPPHLSASPEVRQRFEREAKTISQLSHPHICALYDVGNHEGIEYLVMEFLEGETLEQRLVRGPLPVEQLLRYGMEMTDALDKAHRRGIVHRDLKPGNVMLTASGVKLVDFGLAKLAQARGASGASPTILPTQAGTNLTAEGTILGTFQYMAPEQLEGREADARTDIFAFGAVLYEMATGRKAFTGRSQASLISAILRDEPEPISMIQPMTPPALDRAVKTCLAKDPEDRFHVAHDVRLQLEWIAEGASQIGLPAPVVARRKSRERLAWMANVATALVAVAAMLVYFRLRTEPSRFVRSSINPPEKAAFNFDSGAMALSPDGSRIAFIARGSDGKDLLWVRPLDALAAQPLAGTEGASHPFWSPDSVYLGFFADSKLKKVSASGGAPETLCETRRGRGGTWSREGVILFAPSPGSPIWRVSSSGGAPEEVTRLNPSQGEGSHRWPFFLPDGRHFLYLALGRLAGGRGADRDALYVASLDPKEERKLIGPAASNAVYANPGYLLFYREKTVVARPFDAKRLRFTGEVFPIADQVSRFDTRSAVFSVSENGILAYQSGGDFGRTSQLVWVDRAGKQIEMVGAPGDYMEPRLSHDGRRVAVAVRDSQGNEDIWLYELSRRVATRFTFDPADEGFPAWSPDDSKIVFSSTRTLPESLYEKPSDGTGKEELLYKSDLRIEADAWSPDGRFILLEAFDPKTVWDLWALSVSDRKAIPVVQSEAGDFLGDFSPDGRWIVYTSNESKRPEIYVQRFPEPGGKWQVSNAGGRGPVWSRDGKEIFYVALDGKLMAVTVRVTASGFQADISTALFQTHLKGGPLREYDVSPDGRRFLMNLAAEREENTAPITLVQNWAARARR